MISHKPAWSIALLAFACIACNKGNDESDTGPLVCSDEDTFDTDQCPTSYPDLECTVYVDGDAESSGDGWSWDAPVKTVQEGVDLAHCGAVIEGVCEQWEVWVKKGTYYIHQGCREHTVRLREKVALLGGFDGTETAEWERDWEVNETVLSGLDGPDGENHVYHVAIGADDTVIDGFTVTGGRADGEDELSDDAAGGGMLIINASMTISNCLFHDNEATWGGAVLFDGNPGSGSGVVSDCVFTQNKGKWGGAVSVVHHSVAVSNTSFVDNFATYVGGAIQSHDAVLHIENCEVSDNFAFNTGGGIAMLDQSQLTMVDCDLTGNQSSGSAGAVSGQVCEIQIDRCTITDNRAGWGGAIRLVSNAHLSMENSQVTDNEARFGGGIRVHYSSKVLGSAILFENNSAELGGGVFSEVSEVTFTNSVFNGNTVVFEEDVFEAYIEGAGGAIHSAGSKTRLINTTLYGNSADISGDGVFSTPIEDLEYGIEYTEDDTTVVNSILYGNGVEEVGFLKTPPQVTFSDVEGGFTGEGNIDADPLFVNGSGGDFHLQVASPCISGASPEAAPKTDMDGNPRDLEPDMGAYEYIP